MGKMTHKILIKFKSTQDISSNELHEILYFADEH